MNTKQMKRQISTLIRCMLIVLTVTVLTVSGAGAEGFFSGVFTQTVDTTENSTTLFSRNSGTASITRGYGYDDMSGRQADHVTEYREYGETQYIWEHVDESSLMEYGDFLLRKGFEVIDFGAGSYTTSVYGICNEALYFDFLLAYEWDRQMLMLVFYSDHVNDDDSWNAGYDSGDDDWYAGYDSGNDGYDADYFFMNDQSGSGFFHNLDSSPADSNADSAGRNDRGFWYTDCDDGKCSICNGQGSFKCELCGGTGICGVCGGMPDHYVTGWDHPGTYVTCAGCHGSRRCEYCNGTGEQDCQWCEGGRTSNP